MSTFGKILGLARDVLFVSLGKYGQYVVTLVTVPLCARLLGVEGTGLLAISTAAYFFGSILVDWGLAQILASRTGRGAHIEATRLSYAKLRLLLFALLLVLLVVALVVSKSPVFMMITLGLVAGGISSLGEEWILLGSGQFARIAVFHMCGRVFYLVALLTLLPVIREPWLPMVLLGTGNLIAASISWVHVRKIPFSADKSVTVSNLFRSGMSPAAARLLSAGYGQGSSVYFSLVVSLPALGLFSAADKLTRAAGSALDSFGLALLPRMSKAVSEHDQFWANARKAAWVALSLGILAAATLWTCAPWLINLLYGSEFEAATGLLRIIVFLLPASAMTSMISTSVLYVLEDRRGILGASLLGVCMGGAAFLLTGLSGGAIEIMAISIVTVEYAVLGYNLLRVHHLKKTRTAGNTPVVSAMLK